MLNDSFHESYDRVIKWWNRLRYQRENHIPNKVYAYTQPYIDPKGGVEPPQWQKDMAHWCNNKSLFTSMSFEDFEPRKGFKCEHYKKTLYNDTTPNDNSRGGINAGEASSDSQGSQG